jgi:hypothetical protein
MICHNVFHVLLLEPTTDDAYPGQNMEPPPLVEINSKDEYFIEAILDSPIHRQKLQYLIKCISYDQPDWEYAKLYSKSEAMDTFYKTYPDKLVLLSTQLYNVTSPELSPNRGILSPPNIPKSTIYDITIESYTKLWFTAASNIMASLLITCLPN